MARDEKKVAEARRLREEGALLVEIAATFGVSESTARRWVDPEVASRDRQTSRAWKKEHAQEARRVDRERCRDATLRGRCAGCGGLMGIGRFADGVCSGCRSDRRRQRAERIVSLWAAGAPAKSIAADLGMSSVGYLRVEIDRLRKEGWDLPLRRSRTATPARVGAL